ncbi:hypothetical protein EDD36DRAFT_467455 [Exophiala viscosa]|uniref:Uncharacterized protein n=1 Tax=Exophiala viscosa TaxID=2486360 RepID=A0AAN6IA73_9EURO|nr:hypothetical protein EDD36DRAFT_467455 [Exophiala viscosa]
MAWQPLFLTVMALQFAILILHFLASWADEVFSQWVSAMYQGLPDCFAINYYMDDDELDTFEWCIHFFLFAIVVYKLWPLWSNYDQDRTEGRLSQMFANLPASLVPGFLRSRTSSYNGVEGVLCWVFDTLATFPSSSLLPSEIVFVPGSFPEDNSEEDAVVEGGVVQVNESLESVAVVDVAVQVAVEVSKFAIVAPISTVEIAAETVVHAEDPATDKVALLESFKTGLERDLAAATVRAKDAEKATSALKLEHDTVKAERDELKAKVATLKKEHDDELRQLNTLNTANQQTCEDLQSKLNRGESQYQQWLIERKYLMDEGQKLWVHWETRGQQLEALEATYNSLLQQKEEELRIQGESYNQRYQLVNIKREEWKTLQESYNVEKQQKEAKEQELKARQGQQTTLKEQARDYPALAQRAESRKDRINGLTSDLEAVRQANHTLSEWLKDEKQKVVEKESTIVDLRNQLTLATTTKADVHATPMEVDTESNVTATEVQAKDRLIAELRQELAQARAKAEANDTHMELDTVPSTPMSARSQGNRSTASSADQATIFKTTPLISRGKIGSDPFPVRTPPHITNTTMQAHSLQKVKSEALAEAEQRYVGRIDDLSREKIMLEGELSALGEKNRELSKDAAKWQKDSLKQHRKLVDYDGEKKKLEKKINDLEEEVGDLQTAVQMFKDGHDHDVEEQNEELAKMENKIRRYEEKIKQEKAKTGTLQVDMATMTNIKEAQKWNEQYIEDASDSEEAQEQSTASPNMACETKAGADEFLKTGKAANGVESEEKSEVSKEERKGKKARYHE